MEEPLVVGATLLYRALLESIYGDVLGLDGSTTNRIGELVDDTFRDVISLLREEELRED